MAIGRVLLACAGLVQAGAAPAATPHVRLPLSIAALGAGAEVSYHPNRWISLRRSVAYVEPGAVDQAATSSDPSRLKPRAYAMTGDVHPFRDGFRVSLGMREDDNRRLLRATTDAGDTGTARYAPMMTVGYAEEVGEGLSIGGDVGVLGRKLAGMGGQGSTLVTPMEAVQRRADDGRRYSPLLQLSAGYRF